MADDKKAKKDVKIEKDVKETAGAEDVAAEGGDATGESVEKPRFSAKKIVLFVVLPLLLLGGGGAGAYFMGYLDSFLPGHAVDCAALEEGAEVPPECAEAAALQAEAAGPGAFIDIPPMIVNLSSSAKQPRFLKVTLKIELEKKQDEAVFTELLPRVVDQFQTYLRELRIDDLRGSSGMYRMKIEMLSRVRAAAPNIKVRDVLFQEILVQ